MNSERGTISAVEFARIRQGSYRLLAAGYGRPSAQTTAQVGDGLTALEEMGVASFSFASALRRWEALLATTEPELVASEFVRLFGSGMDGAVCPPIESQQLGANLQGDPARYAGRIEDLLRRTGFEATGDDRPPDHLMVELELASALCGAEAAARATGEAASAWLEWQQELVVVLSKWVPAFAVIVAERDRSGVYGALADATDSFIEHERDLVRMLLAAAETTQ